MGKVFKVCWCLFNIKLILLTTESSRSKMRNYDKKPCVVKRIGAGVKNSVTCSSLGLASRRRAGSYERKLVKLLRHDAVKCGLSVCRGGLVSVEEVLSYLGGDEVHLRQVVEENRKKAFWLGDAAGTLKIGAVQGHSFSVPELELRLVNVFRVPVVYHGTRKELREAIRTEGIKRMGRDCVHLSKKMTGERGIRSGSDCVVCVDVWKLTAVGVSLYEARNQVILCKVDIPASCINCIHDVV